MKAGIAMGTTVRVWMKMYHHVGEIDDVFLFQPNLKLTRLLKDGQKKRVA